MLLLPVMPTAAAEILRRVGETREPSALRVTDAAWKDYGARVFVKGAALWPRLEVPVQTPASGVTVENAVTDPSQPPSVPVVPANAPAAPAPSTAAPAPAPAAPAAGGPIGIDQFMSIELRVARVLTAERVPKSRKLMQLRIDAGSEERTIVAGIAEAYDPEALTGKLIVIVANLKPAKLMGIESNGMVLAASSDAGLPVLVEPGPGSTPGMRVR